MPKLIFLIGLPGSGKSTFAKQYQKENTGTKRVNKDDLRAMLDDGIWSKSNEKTVLSVQKQIVSDCLYRGHDVIIDNTHLDKKHEEEYREFCLDNSYLFETKFFDVDVEACIRRDKKRSNPVGAKVILDMYNRYLRPEPLKVEYDYKLQDCILVDIDGTLAQKGDRDIYDYSQVYMDSVIEPVKDVVKALDAPDQNCEIILLSGREDSCIGETSEWLKDNRIPFANLFMRKTGDKRCDSIVKKELYENYIKGKYNVKFVVDDRKRVKRMWVNEGLFVFDVNQNDIEF